MPTKSTTAKIRPSRAQTIEWNVIGLDVVLPETDRVVVEGVEFLETRCPLKRIKLTIQSHNRYGVHYASPICINAFQALLKRRSKIDLATKYHQKPKHSPNIHLYVFTYICKLIML